MGEAAKWACNSAQWIRTALTDIRHAVEQAAAAHEQELVREYDKVAHRLEDLNAYLEREYGVPPPTGVGRRQKRGKKADPAPSA